MTNYIWNAFKSMLNDSTWLDAESKQKVLEKVNYMKSQIGYPTPYDDNKYIQDNFNV